ncbi:MULTISPECIES: type IV pilus modification protein PilV [Acinetobacter]|uniref:type IV pilus modification protein PilV n=1 Tax=Acinetobacter TaxID=469 RepID=UPI000F67B8C3|nr:MULTISPECIES: type IV pilus modification protein PilV [Acinetobacter]MBL8281109.1 type IV pilus modification protein PilV [Acinetobacter junii]MBY3626589.1 type IV pilus modification protein PilV [Acinetobacter sp. CUI P1]MDA3501754.1 type IV pilus modification protein PilV [Acinetobacter sp. AOR34_HL]RSE37850.1 type IV pilus modification protein PilV [Acinetobacter junii]
MMKRQTGVGLVEVLVALVLLSIAVLGFVALQIRAITASNEATMNVQATNIARDLAERMRMNRDGLAGYVANTDTTNCATAFCSPEDMAKYDFRLVSSRATGLGMRMNVLNCQGSTLVRKCVYVAWEGTTATNGTGSSDCTNGAAYVPNAKCIIMEVYNYGS